MSFNKVNRKVQGITQSQTAANPRHQEEAKKDKQTNVREAQRQAPSFPSEVIPVVPQLAVGFPIWPGHGCSELPLSSDPNVLTLKMRRYHLDSRLRTINQSYSIEWCVITSAPSPFELKLETTFLLYTSIIIYGHDGWTDRRILCRGRYKGPQSLRIYHRWLDTCFVRRDYTGWIVWFLSSG